MAFPTKLALAAFMVAIMLALPVASAQNNSISPPNSSQSPPTGKPVLTDSSEKPGNDDFAVTPSGESDDKSSEMGDVKKPEENEDKKTVCTKESTERVDEIVREMKDAEESGDQKKLDELNEKLKDVKGGIDAENKCETEHKKRSTGAGDCPELEETKKKLEHFEGVSGMSDDDIVKKGFESKDDVEKTKKALETRIKELSDDCGSTGGAASAAPGKPIAPASGSEISDYYTSKISTILSSGTDTVTALKQLRDEIDNLIEQLIKGSDELRTDEMGGLVKEMTIKPNTIEADSVVVSTTKKKILTKLGNSNIEIEPRETDVIVRDGNLEVTSQELGVKNNALMVGQHTVEISANDIVKEIKKEPKKIELREEDGKAVYKITTDEDRKLFGFIPMKVGKEMTVDAGATTVSVLKEKLPWWGFLTTK